MNDIIGLKKLRQDAQEIINKVARGQSFIVVRRSKPVFEINPVHTSKPIDLRAWKKAAGMWKGRGGPDPVKWQRKIRQESERTFI
ncbi:MAG: type II toxin-antitoxin system prevent-host-death family antitoxin [Patescibacteria group bacterium]